MTIANPKRNQLSESESLGNATDQAVEACSGDLRATIWALIVARQFLEAQISQSYRRGAKYERFSTYPG
jgi:hypothetical protein